MSVERSVAIEPEATDAVLFDLDGVITSTDRLHARAWKQTFDALLRELASERGEEVQLFDIDTDYPQHVDGKPRKAGIRAFLASRGIELPEGEAGEPPGLDSVAAIAERKNRRFHELLRTEGAQRYPDALVLLDKLQQAGIKVGLFSASRNARQVLDAVDLTDRFEVIVDGNVAADLDLEGKPAPETLLEAARRLVVAPERTVVLEDSEAGVEAGHRGGFQMVIGVDRVSHADALEASGADVALSNLEDVQVPTNRPEELPNALEADSIRERIAQAPPVVFLDFDGTLSPIVRRPDLARIPEATRDALARLAEGCTVAVISGRGLEDVRQRVGLEHLHYAGSHGFEIEGPDRERVRHSVAEESLDALAAVERELEDQLADVEGVILERKPFSLAVHDREVRDGELETVRQAVTSASREHPDLRVSSGKRVHELQPDVDRHKGHAVEHLLAELDVDRGRTPIVYVGDDVTDEDAFRTLPDAICVLVADGRQATHAGYVLADTDEVRVFIEQIADMLEEERT